MASFRILLSIFLFHLLLQGSFGIDLNQTCREIVDGDPNVNFSFCMTTFQAVPCHTVNLDGLGLIAMNLTRSNASSTIRYIQRILKQKALRPYMRNCLKDCLDLYSDGVSSLNDAVNDIKIENYNEANVQISATMDAPVTCEDGFKEKKGVKSPLTKRNADTFQLSAIVLSIISMLSQDRI